jgi:NlpC/P60 family putative phage cell wall peptidase|uniref:NlpC/P60 family protein n=1 Tax=Yoonia sp. TaxID=2212373 RepID=UPI004047C578|tara:strand:+ start:9035 stop:9463 length:429 start_codon:yes stop_codon:yes gene_type:complete
MSGAQVVEIARTWLGTPYVHQASKCGAGTDCLGLVRGIWRALHGSEPEAIPRYTADWSEPQGQEVLWAAAHRHLQPVARAELCAGDVILFRMKRGAVAKHLGIVAHFGPAPTFIHAYTGHGVVESPLSEPWRKRIVAKFVFR